MERIHSGLSAGEFSKPETIIEKNLCSETHLLAQDGVCPSVYTEYFAEGTEPDEVCSLHEPEPETEEIQIYQDILDQLLPETETESERGAQSDNESEADLDSGSDADTGNSANDDKDIENGTIADIEDDTETGNLTGDGTESAAENENNSEDASEMRSDASSESETSSLEDLMNRLTGLR
ncbi:MAG: hypothetical protein LUH07_11695 [Lachnospiraceae bacterium]|nr:hypothetical protein [Lachnospiraceae bacterium]